MDLAFVSGDPSREKKMLVTSTSEVFGMTIHKNCCTNKTIDISADFVADKTSSTNLIEVQKVVVCAFVEAFILGSNSLNKLTVPYLNYMPPLLNRDIPVLIQSFLL